MKETNNGTKGGTLKGKPHSKGGIKAVVGDSRRPVELEGGEVIINKEASKKHWKELSRINQSAGNGVPIENPNGYDDNPSEEEYETGGVIVFDKKHLPNKNILKFAEKLKSEHKDIWDKAGNIYGNEAFKNLKRVSERGYWLDSEEWFYKKWRSYVARHKKDFRLKGTIAMIKWVDEVEKGWSYMKDIVEEEIAKKSKNKMAEGGSTYGVSDEVIENYRKNSSQDIQQEKVAKVMREFKEGKLKTPNGKVVTNDRQAIAIALSEAGIGRDKKDVGGNIHKDLFEFYEEQPKELSIIVDAYQELYLKGDMDYADTQQFLKEVNAIGYTFDFGLDNEPFALRPINVRLNDVEGFEEFKEGGKVLPADEIYEDGDMVEFKKGGIPPGRKILFKNDDVSLEYNEVSESYAIYDNKAKKYIMKYGGNTKYSLGGRAGEIKRMLEKNKKKSLKEQDEEILLKKYKGTDLTEAEALRKTEELANKILRKDYAPLLKNSNIVGKYFKDYKEIVPYKLGWRFNWGQSKQWAGLCSIKDTNGALSSLERNIFISYNFAKHDKNWLDNVEETIYHEVAHGLIFEHFILSVPAKPEHLRQIAYMKLLSEDPEHGITKGHGKIFKEVCKTIAEIDYCPSFYLNADFKESIKEYVYKCTRCKNQKYGDSENFAKRCSECKTTVVVIKNKI